MNFKNILQFYLNKLHKEFNLIPIFGCELEFYILFNETQKHTAFGSGDFTSVLKNNWYHEIIKSGLNVVEERGLNQFEVKLGPTEDIFKLLEEIEILKNSITQISRKYGATILFTAQPFDYQPGSAMHVHLNFVGKSNYNNLKDTSQYLHYAIGGLLHTLPDLMFCFAPNINSYKRYAIQSMTAPKNISWGYNNRTAALRLLKNYDGISRIEHRVAGSDTNLLEVAAAIICGSYVGIKEKLLPIPPTYGLAFDSQYDLTSLPVSLIEAKKNFTKSKFSDMFTSFV